MKALKVGVLGTGNMGRNHLRVLSTMAEYELLGCFDTDADLCAGEATKYQIKAFTSPAELFAAVDVVHIVTPSFLHRQGAAEAAAAGCHVLVEKPIALTLADADAIIQACAGAGVKLSVGHVERYNPAVMTLAKILADKNVIALTFERLSPRGDRILDASVVEDLMIHDIDVLLSLVRQPIQRIVSEGSRIYTKNLDYAQALISFTNGTMASLIASRVTEAKVRTAKITSEDAYISVNYLDRTVEVSRKSNITTDSESAVEYSLESLTEKIMVPIAEPLRLEFEHFAQCINNDTEVMTSGEDARQALQVCQIIQDQATAV